MKTPLRFITVFLLFFFLIGWCTAQERQTDVVKVYLNYASPYSETRFKEKYETLLDLNFSYNRFLSGHVFYGLSFEYSLFQPDQSKLSYTLNTKMHVLNPALLMGYKYDLTENIFLKGILQAGYSWVLFGNSDYSDLAKAENNSGFSLNPLIESTYKINDNLNIGLQFSYKIIFCYFGKDLGYDTREDSNIRYFTYGICASITL